MRPRAKPPLWTCTFPALLASSAALAINGTPSWQLSLVAPSPGVERHLTSPCLQFDHYGTAALTWTDASSTGLASNDLRHSELTELGLWSHRTLTSGSGIGAVTALSYDRSERPQVAWINSPGGGRGGSFNYQTPQSISSGPAASTSPPLLSLRHDLAGNLRGAYAGSTPGEIGGISWNGSTYNGSLLTTISDVSSLNQLSLTTDQQGRRHLIAAGRNGASTPAVFLASEPSNSSTWVSGTVATGDAVGGADIDSNPNTGRTAWAYSVRTGSTWRLYYVESNNGILSTPLAVVTGSYAIGGLSLAFDLSDGQPAIAFADMDGSRLLFAYRTTGGWNTGVVANDFSTTLIAGDARVPSLAFNDFGTGWPAIAYVRNDGAMVVAFDPPATPEPASLAFWGLATALTATCRRRDRRAARL